MRRLAALIAILSAGPAAAAGDLPPELYAAARQRAPDVIVISVETVVPPLGAPWRCAVKARVAAIERGERYRVGQRVKIPVRCGQGGLSAAPDHSGVFQDTDALVASKRARVWLESGYPLLDQYDILPAT